MSWRKFHQNRARSPYWALYEISTFSHIWPLLRSWFLQTSWLLRLQLLLSGQTPNPEKSGVPSSLFYVTQPKKIKKSKNQPKGVTWDFRTVWNSFSPMVDWKRAKYGFKNFENWISCHFYLNFRHHSHFSYIKKIPGEWKWGMEIHEEMEGNTTFETLNPLLPLMQSTIWKTISRQQIAINFRTESSTFWISDCAVKCPVMTPLWSYYAFRFRTLGWV